MKQSNENSAGYKKTKIGWLPNDWECLPLEKIISKLCAGVSVNSYDEPIQGNGDDEIGVLKTSCVNKGIFLSGENKRILPDEVQRSRVSPQKNTMIMSRMNTKNLVGDNALIDKDYPSLRLPDRLWSFGILNKSENSILWLAHLLSSPRMRSNISSRATGTSGSMKNITQEDIMGLSIPRPPFPEQEKIAEVLSTWRSAIEQTMRLIAAKRRRKQGLMQQLLTGKMRFKEFVKSKSVRETKYGTVPMDWEYLKVAEVASEVSERNAERADLPVLSCSKYDGLVESLKYFGKRVFSEDTTNYRVVRRNQFAYPCNHVEEGSIGVLDFLDAGIVSPIYAVFQTDDRIHDPFLYALFKTDLYRHIFEVSTSASVDRRGSLRWNEFAKIHIALPSVDEQKKIALCLNDNDKEIETLCRKLDALKEQKKGLMQQLLTGKVRVKYDANG